MLKDQYGRHIHYLRVSVTDRCNYACQYCRPALGVPLKSHEEILSLETLLEIIRFFVDAGIDKVRLTGGEPLVRKNLVYLVRELAGLSGIKDLCMTTNGALLAQHAQSLRDAGLNRVNISLDTLDPQRFAAMTRGGVLGDVLAGIAAARTVGFAPIKLNMVLIKGFNDDEVDAMSRFAQQNQLEIRYIRQMNLGTGERYLIENAQAGQCESCNRLRLTCDGLLKPCLFSNTVINLKQMDLPSALKQVLAIKPSHGTCNTSDCMVQLGG